MVLTHSRAHVSGRPTEVIDNQIKGKIEKNRHITVQETAEKLSVSHTHFK